MFHPQIKCGVRSPKFIWAPGAQLYSLAETRNLPPPHLVHCWASSLSKLAASSSSHQRKFQSASGGENDRRLLIRKRTASGIVIKIQSDPIAESTLSSSTKKILGTEKNPSAAVLDGTGVFCTLTYSLPPNPSPHTPPPPTPTLPITHCWSTYQSLAQGAWLPLPLSPNLPSNTVGQPPVCEIQDENCGGGGGVSCILKMTIADQL